VTVQLHDTAAPPMAAAIRARPQTFTITVTAVHDAAELRKGADQVTLEDAGVQNGFGMGNRDHAGRMKRKPSISSSPTTTTRCLPRSRRWRQWDADLYAASNANDRGG